jgi:hypothetical protein
MSVPDVPGALIRIQMEYVEMPELKLTAAQVSRLCALPLEVCRVALVTLAASGFLRRDTAGAYLRSGAAPLHVDRLDARTWTLGAAGA